jgi:hypothetical protein
VPDLSSIKSLNKKEKAELEVLLAEYIRRQRMKKFFTYYPEEGPLSRHAYPKHISFMDAGATYRERCTMKANRVGGTEGIGCYELTCHLTGKYPDWWKGRRFKQPIRAWAAGTTAETTRDILQRKLLGPLNDQRSEEHTELQSLAV